MDSEATNYKMLSWNVRRLNNLAKCEDVNQIVSILKADLVCIQETKMSAIDSTIVRASPGMEYDSNFAFLSANGTRGGILLAAKI